MTNKVLMNRYQLKEKIGYGGMGQVFLGWDNLLQRDVAIKIMASFDEQIRERYRREAASLASLNHNNIIKIYDVGEEAGSIFIVMEFIRGSTLQDIIKAKAPLKLEEGLRIIHMILQGLREVHRKGIVHRDLKPQNILITSQGQVKLCDFGIAKVGTLETLTVTGMALGTVQYMAPEQLMGGEVSPASDLYSLGVILYEMFTGYLPFNGNNLGEIAQKHFNLNPPPLSSLNPRIIGSLDLVAAKCLAKKPRDRFQQVQEILKLVEDIIESQQKNTALITMSNNPTKQYPIAPQFTKLRLRKCIKNYLINLIKKIPLLRIFTTTGVVLFCFYFFNSLLNGINNLGPELENRTKSYLKQSIISELQNKMPFLPLEKSKTRLDNKAKENLQDKSVKDEVQKVRNSLQILQKDFQQGDEKLIKDNIEQFNKNILTDKEILQKLKERLSQEYTNLIETEKIEKQFEYLKDYQKKQGKKARRKHFD